MHQLHIDTCGGKVFIPTYLMGTDTKTHSGRNIKTHKGIVDGTWILSNDLDIIAINILRRTMTAEKLYAP